MSQIVQRPLGEIAALQAGVGFPLSMQGKTAGRYPFAKVGDISRGGRSGSPTLGSADHFVDEADLASLRAKPIPKGSVLFAKIGEAIRQNHRVMAGCDMLVDNNAMAAIPRTGTFPTYLYHFLRTVDLYPLASTTTVPSLRKTDLERIPVPFPPLDEQRRIAEVLDRAEALRAKRRAALAQLDTLTQSIFLDLFGDPKTNANCFPEVPLASLFAAKPIFGTMIPPAAGAGAWVSLRVANIQDWRLDLSDQKHVALPASAVDRHSVRDGDLLMARAIASQEHLGKAVVAYPGDRKWAFDSHLMRLRFKLDLATPEFIRHLLMTPGGRQLFLKASRRSAVQFNINTKEMAALRIPVPPIALQREFVRRLAAVEAIGTAQRRSLAELDALFASLQHRAFRGEL